ncbi:MAG: peptidylprolyl isomerase [Ignavibacteriales bacterium]|nr:peptidylprolyl isomerase [Ignavibacteriales bacterium]
MDSTLFVNLPTEAIERIKNLVLYNLGNTEYTDCFNALTTLLKTVSTEWSQDLIRIIKTTSIKSVAEKFGKKTNPSNILEKLNSDLLKSATVVISTTKGHIVVQLNPAIAPVSSANFLSLANKNYFNNIEFHRVVPGFVIQAGDPTGTGSGGPGYEIITELSPFHYKKGTLGMARSDFNTEGSQWFITTGEYYHLDGNYTVFGTVLSGLDVAENITQDDSIISVSVND